MKVAATNSAYNWIGRATGGSQHEAGMKAHSALGPFLGTFKSSRFGSRGSVRTDPQHGALPNGIASQVHDFVDTHLETILHAAGPIASALLAYAEYCGGVNGEGYLVAFVARIKGERRLGLAV